ncbi:MAG: hypothetical protein ACREBG_23145, partial [Pyrinomonadaceae bacterium]
MPSIDRHDHFQDITLTGNLSPGDDTRVTNNLIPFADNTEDLGTAALRWRELFVGTLIAPSNLTVTGNLISPKIGPSGTQQHTLPVV